MRYAWIKSQQGTFSIKAMCRVLQVRRSGYYTWKRLGASEREAEGKRLDEGHLSTFRSAQRALRLTESDRGTEGRGLARRPSSRREEDAGAGPESPCGQEVQGHDPVQAQPAGAAAFLGPSTDDLPTLRPQLFRIPDGCRPARVMNTDSGNWNGRLFLKYPLRTATFFLVLPVVIQVTNNAKRRIRTAQVI